MDGGIIVCLLYAVSENLEGGRDELLLLPPGPNKPQWSVCALRSTLLFTVMISSILT
jgi:hypothetical protein